jgi:cytochrome c oxidase cbb3-type subunit 3
MSLRCHHSLAAIALLLILGGCAREKRPSPDRPSGAELAAQTSPDTIFPGSGQLPPIDPRAAAFEGNAYAIAQGQLLFGSMNCAGCHSHGGGGMGPALMDDEWRYGGRIDQIATSIMEGRPNGMPAWRGRITDQQMWQLAAYVRSLSGQVAKDMVSARTDEMSNTPPLTQAERLPVRQSDSDRQ